MNSSEIMPISDKEILININNFLCDDSEGDAYSKIISTPMFQPESFTVGDRENKPPFLNQSERNFDVWCDSLIRDQLMRLSESMAIDFDDINNIVYSIKRNVEKVLNYKYAGNQIKNQIWNQEFIDILHNIIIYSLFGNFDQRYSTHRKFKDLSKAIMPKIIENICSNNHLRLEDYLKLSIISGISGLDLKGTSAASSLFSQNGIPMSSYFNLPLKESTKIYCNNLITMLNCTAPIFEWGNFIDLVNNRAKIVWFTDDYIETFFDLLFINKLLETYSDAQITIVPKRIECGNDASYSDVLDILRCCKNEFKMICKLLREKQRVNINRFGPSMGTVNIKKLSNEIIDLIYQSDVVIFKGCRAHEMVQGGLNKTTFNMYIVAREFSESVTGYDAREMPILFFHLPPGGYAFRGFKNRYLREVCINGKKIYLSETTLKDSYAKFKKNVAGNTCQNSAL
ncbi:MAG: ARMT1-like domain-containing protein [Methanothrix sp.]|nr:ARMT1-like domain-containing protein [Methanothrix sp.]